MGEAQSAADDSLRVEGPMKQEYFCLSCGELFEPEAPTGESPVLPECPSCRGRDVEVQKPVTNLPRPFSRYDRGMCACEIVSLSHDTKNQS